MAPAIGDGHRVRAGLGCYARRAPTPRDRGRPHAQRRDPPSLRRAPRAQHHRRAEGAPGVRGIYVARLCPLRTAPAGRRPRRGRHLRVLRRLLLRTGAQVPGARQVPDRPRPPPRRRPLPRDHNEPRLADRRLPTRRQRARRLRRGTAQVRITHQHRLRPGAEPRAGPVGHLASPGREAERGEPRRPRRLPRRRDHEHRLEAHGQDLAGGGAVLRACRRRDRSSTASRGRRSSALASATCSGCAERALQPANLRHPALPTLPALPPSPPTSRARRAPPSAWAPFPDVCNEKAAAAVAPIAGEHPRGSLFKGWMKP